MNTERPYYQDINYHPFLFYVVFGADCTSLSVSREKHRVSEFPKGLDLFMVQRPENNDYMDAMLGGSIADTLRRSEPELFDAALASDVWTVLRGEITNDATLGYMSNTIGIVQALAEQNAAAILDLQTFTLFSADEWNDTYFTQELDPCAHADILVSQTDSNTCWLHTRGMRKFGRPDISIENIPINQCIETAKQIIDQMIFYGAQGAFFSRAVKLHTHDGHACIVSPAFIEDMDDPDFNNCHYRILWEECDISPEN